MEQLTIHNEVRMLMVSPSADSRTRVREVVRSIVNKEYLQFVRTLPEAENVLRVGVNFQVVLATSSLGPKNVKKLLSLPAMSGEKATPVLVAFDGKAPQLTSMAAEFFMAGAVGFISEPYSAQDFSHILNVCLDEKSHRNEDARLRRLAHFLGSKAVSLVDELAQFRMVQPTGGGRSGVELKIVSEKLRELFAREPALIEAALLNPFAAADPFDESKKRSASSRIVNHPGFDLAVMIASRNVSVDALSTRLGIPVDETRQLLEGKRDIDESVAAGIARLLGGQAKEWLDKQKKYDKFISKQS